MRFLHEGMLFTLMDKPEARLDFVDIQINQREYQSVIQQQAGIKHYQENKQQHGSHLRKFLHQLVHIQQETKYRIHDDNCSIKNE